jgi:gliding motility-associated-like protein
MSLRRFVKMRIFVSASLMVFICLSFSVRAELSRTQAKQLLPPPVWSCIQTVNADLLLNWQAVADPGGNFSRYEVYSIQDGLIASITNINTTTYTHTTISNIRDYYIAVVDNTGTTYSDTLKNIRLALNNPGNGTAVLNWNTTGENISAPNSSMNYLMREYPSGTFTKRDSTVFGNGNFRDTIDICNAFINYQIQYPGNGCISTSNVVGDNFEDKISPFTPIIQNITIDTLTGNVNINWNINPARDTYGYVIYKQNTAGFLVEIDTVWGRLNTNYNYVENTSQGSLSYSIAAFDSCYTQTIPATFQTSAKSSVHTSSFLNGTYNPCLSAVSLSWTNYLGWSNVQNYEVFVTDVNNDWQSQGTFNANQHTLYFTASGLYQFVVKARHADGRNSFSNVIQIQVSTSGPPSINYLQVSSVQGKNAVLRHLVDLNANVGAIAFDRLHKDGTFKEVGRVNVTSNPTTTFLDETADVEKVNVYRAVVVDSCGNRTTISNQAHTIFLTVTTDKNTETNQLTWTPYIGFDGTIASYEVYRFIDGVKENSPAALLSSAEYNFSDALGNMSPKNTLCYSIIAIENTNSYGMNEEAQSNHACADLAPTIYIPNAFTPNGLNPIFRPVYAFVNYPAYDMRVFNRWGRLVYQTNVPMEGWNGMLDNNSEPAEPGVYLYRIIFERDEQEPLKFEGSVTLIR